MAQSVSLRAIRDPAIADLATVFGVSRQAIYKWIGGESTPETDKLERIRSLSLAADAFQKAEVTRASSLLKMKTFEGRYLVDLVAAGQLVPEHTQTLIAEAQAMDAAYSRSGLAKSKQNPSIWYISHYVYKDQNKLSSRDESKVATNWMRIEGVDNDS